MCVKSAQVLKAMQRRIVSSIPGMGLLIGGGVVRDGCRRAEGAGAAGIDVGLRAWVGCGAVGGVAAAMKMGLRHRAAAIHHESSPWAPRIRTTTATTTPTLRLTATRTRMTTARRHKSCAGGDQA